VTRAWRQETVCLQIETIESSGRPSAFVHDCTTGST